MAVSTTFRPSAALLSKDVPLLPRTSLRVGGRAAFGVTLGDDPEELAWLLDYAEKANLALEVLGQGSNVVIADTGVDGVVVWLGDGRTTFFSEPDGVRVRATAGVDFDELCAQSTAEGLMGLAALSGIPGSAGAAPVQNIGAYGQALSDVLVAVDVVDRQTKERGRIAADALGLGYRSSHLKGQWSQRFIVTAIELFLPTHAVAPPPHAQLARALGKTRAVAPPAEVRRAVLALRGDKGMLWRPDAPLMPPHHAGSFFTNPIVSQQHAEQLLARMPSLPAFVEQGGHKLSAAFLIESAGFHRGWRDKRCDGRVGLSPRHALALSNFGGASASELLAAAKSIQEAVEKAFGVALVPEPRFVGFFGVS